MPENDSFMDLGVQSSFMGNTADLEAFLEGDDEAEVKKKQEEAANKDKQKKVKQEAGTASVEEEDESQSLDEVMNDDEEEETTDDEKDPSKKKEVKSEDEEKTEEEDEEKEEGEAAKLDFNALVNDLFEIGVLTKDDQDNGKEFTSGEQLAERFAREGQKKAVAWLDGFLSQHGDDRKELFDAIFMSGVDPKEYLPVYNNVVELGELDLSVEDNQKKVYREFYKRVGLDEATVERKLQKAIDYGDLADESEALHQQIITQDNQKRTEMEQKAATEAAERKRQDEEYKKSIVSILNTKLQEKEFDGLPVNEKDVREAFDFLYTKKYKAPNGDLLTEFDKFILDTKRPENHAKRVLIALLAKNNFDFSRIQKKAVSKQSGEIFKSLTQKTVKAKSAASSGQKSIWSNI
jgi:hypothetical protein